MAVQQLAKDQAKREKQKQKKLDDKFAKDEEKNLKDIEDTMRLMEERRNKSFEIYKGEPNTPSDMKNLKQVIEFFEENNRPNQRLLKDVKNLKSGGQVKCGVQMKGTSPLIKKRKGKK